MDHLINKIKNAGIEVKLMTPMQEKFLKKYSTKTNYNVLGDEIRRYLFDCNQSNKQDSAMKIGTLSDSGARYLKRLSGYGKFDNMDIYLSADSAKGIIKNHFSNNEKDLVHNKSLTDEDIHAMADIIRHPDQIHATIDSSDGKQMYLFYKHKPDIGTVIAELELDRHAGNLHIIDYFISQKDIYRRFNEMNVIDNQKIHVDQLKPDAVLPIMAELVMPQKQVLASVEPFYSNAENGVYSITQEKATPAQWLAMLTKNGGIKAGEDKWTGLSEWLKNHTGKSLDKSEILQYIDSNRISLHEDHYLEMEKSPEFEKLNREFFSCMENIDDEYREADERIEEFYSLMRTKYEDDDFLYYMSDDEREREEELHNERDKYDCTLNSREDIAWNMMYDKYGTHFEYAFSYDSDGLSINDYDEAERFIPGSAIDEIRLENVTEGLVNYHEIALWSENAEQWMANDTIHFGEVGNGRNIGWIRFGETTVKIPLSEDELQKRIEAMPKPSEWTKMDGSQFVTKNDIYYPPGHNRFTSSVFISKSSEGRSFTYHPERGSGLICMTLKEAVDLYNKDHVHKYDEQKVLVIDEVQSNRHQQGRKMGYQKSDEEMEHIRERLADIMKEKVRFQDSLTDKYGSEMFGHYATPEEIQHLGELDEQTRHLLQQMKDNGRKIPAAPFETNWHELCMKRMLRYAAENGYDKLAWTKGEQQVMRYDLARIVQAVGRDSDWNQDKYVKIWYNQNCETGFYVKPDGYIYDSPLGWDGKHINELMGKEQAEQVLAMPENSRQDIKQFTIGNEGVSVFYDRILPNYMDKYGKRWGIRSTEIELPELSIRNGYLNEVMKMHCIDITDEMKKSVLQGQPMFMRDHEGFIYGYAMDDTIYLSSKGMNHETLVHEYTHLWAAAMQHGNPKGWQSIKDLLKETALWNDVLNDLLYSDISHNENLVASEVLARISGSRNAARIAEAAVRTANQHSSDNKVTHPAGVYNSILRALETFWSWVGKHMFDIKHFNDINEVTDRVLYDLLQGNRLETGKVMLQTDDVNQEFPLVEKDVNQRFNNKLDGFNFQDADKFVFDLGRPTQFLKDGGVVDKPIKLYGSKLAKKMKEHNIDKECLVNLPIAVGHPIAVFDNYNRSDNRSILTELKTKEGNLLVALNIGKGEDIDFEIVTTVTGKAFDRIIHWINKGFITNVDKEKALTYLHLPAPIAGALNKQELLSATKIINNFELSNFEKDINTLPRFSNIQIFKGRGGQPHIRCKVDGEQQMGVPVKPQDLYAIHNKSRLLELAECYFRHALNRTESQNKSMKL